MPLQDFLYLSFPCSVYFTSPFLCLIFTACVVQDSLVEVLWENEIWGRARQGTNAADAGRVGDANAHSFAYHQVAFTPSGSYMLTFSSLQDNTKGRSTKISDISCSTTVNSRKNSSRNMKHTSCSHSCTTSGNRKLPSGHLSRSSCRIFIMGLLLWPSLCLVLKAALTKI